MARLRLCSTPKVAAYSTGGDSSGLVERVAGLSISINAYAPIFDMQFIDLAKFSRMCVTTHNRFARAIAAV